MNLKTYDLVLLSLLLVMLGFVGSLVFVLYFCAKYMVDDYGRKSYEELHLKIMNNALYQQLSEELKNKRLRSFVLKNEGCRYVVSHKTVQDFSVTFDKMSLFVTVKVCIGVDRLIVSWILGHEDATVNAFNHKGELFSNLKLNVGEISSYNSLMHHFLDYYKEFVETKEGV